MNRKRQQVIIFKFIFFIYIVVALYFLFFAESMGRTIASAGYRYNLKPFKEIKRFLAWSAKSETGMKSMLLNVFGNIFCFVPLGFFVPAVTKKLKNGLSVILLCFFSSVAVELIQLVTMTGSCDVDDIILNTLGGVIGYIFYVVAVKIKRLRSKKSMQGT